MNPSRFYAVVSGDDRSVGATLTRGALRLAEFPYAAAMRWRNYRFDQGQTATRKVEVPVISVGNLSLGGTGKTPLVAWLAERLSDRGIRLTILSRGYGGASPQGNDESQELHARLPHVAHLQHPDRARSAETAIREHGSQLILMDDGFQHRRLVRDLDIVLLDGQCPFGYGHVFPRGTLREPLAGLARADLICLTRADSLDIETRHALRQRLSSVAGTAQWCETAHQPQQLVNGEGQTRACQRLRDQPLVGFCGIGNPNSFSHTLRQTCGYDLRDFREYPDHHSYNAHDLHELASWAQARGAAALVCTHKDLVKIRQTELGSLPLWALQVQMHFLSGEAALLTKIDTVLQQHGLPILTTRHGLRPAGPDPTSQCA